MSRNYNSILYPYIDRWHNAVSSQRIEEIRKEYSLTNPEMDELIHYCKENGVTIYDKEKQLKMIKLIADRIMHVASIQAHSTTKRGWICGNYANKEKDHVQYKLDEYFSFDQLEFIVDHLPPISDDENCLELEDQHDQELCNRINDKLNQMIPPLKVITYHTHDFLD